METLISKLNLIPNAYFEFIDSVVDYASSKASHLKLLTEYLDKNPSATVTDILRLISTQPDFFDDETTDEADVLVG